MGSQIPAHAVEGLTTPGSGAAAAAAVSVTPAGSLAATDVQAALAELDAEKAPVGHVHTAASVTYAGSTNLAAVNVEAALDELDAEKSPVGHTHPASGITVQDENGTVATGVTQIDFQGAGVTATAGTGEVVVTIPVGDIDGGSPDSTYGGTIDGGTP